MTTLAQILLAPGQRELVVGKTAGWIERYVADRGGFKGLTLKTALRALKALRHDALELGIDRLLPDFAAALDPLFQRFRVRGSGTFGAYVGEHIDEATAALMAVTDARAARASHAGLKSIYRRLRGTLEGELHTVLPKLVAGFGKLGPSDKNRSLEV